PYISAASATGKCREMPERVTIEAMRPSPPAPHSDEPPWGDPDRTLSPARTRSVVEGLRAVLPADNVLSSEEELRPYECDGLSAFRCLPVAVALPRTEAEVRDTLQACRALDVPVVARGAGTGLSGGAMPHPCSVVLSLARLNRILAVDPVARTARVQPG